MRDIAPAPSSSRTRRSSQIPPDVVYPPGSISSSTRPTRLVGPGVPGDDPYLSRRMVSPPSAYPAPGRASSLSGPSGLAAYPGNMLHGDTRTRAEDADYGHERRHSSYAPPIQLPPLQFDQHRQSTRRTSHDAQPSGSRLLHTPPRPPSTSDHASPPPPSSYSTRLQALPPPRHSQQSPASPQSLPPPFTLEPNPQWTPRSSVSSSTDLRGISTSGESPLVDSRVKREVDAFSHSALSRRSIQST